MIGGIEDCSRKALVIPSYCTGVEGGHGTDGTVEDLNVHGGEEQFAASEGCVAMHTACRCRFRRPSTAHTRGVLTSYVQHISQSENIDVQCLHVAVTLSSFADIPLECERS